MRSKDSQNKTKQIKYNDINKNILQPNSETVVVATKWLPSNTKRQKQRGVCL